MKQIVLQVVALVLALYFFFMFDEGASAWLLAFVVAYNVVALGFCLYSRTLIEVELPQKEFSVERNEQIPVPIILKNYSAITQNVSIKLQVENQFTGEKTRMKIRQRVPKYQKEKAVVMMEVQHCGTVLFSIKKLQVFDLFQLLSIGRKINRQMQICVLPKIHLIPLEISQKTRNFISDAEEYSNRERGDDVSELYQIREYTKDDLARNIHWKVSAKSEELFVKDYGKPLGSAVLILFHTNVSKGQKKMKRFDAQTLELVSSISTSLYEQKCIHTVAWYEPKRHSVEKKKIAKEKNVYELLNRLVLIQLCEEEHLDEIFDDTFSGQNYSSVIEVFVDGTVKIDKEPITVPRNKEEIEWKNLGFSV